MPCTSTPNSKLKGLEYSGYHTGVLEHGANEPSHQDCSHFSLLSGIKPIRCPKSWAHNLRQHEEGQGKRLLISSIHIEFSLVYNAQCTTAMYPIPEFRFRRGQKHSLDSRMQPNHMISLERQGRLDSSYWGSVREFIQTQVTSSHFSSIVGAPSCSVLGSSSSPTVAGK